MVHLLKLVFNAGYAAVVALFLICALYLIGLAAIDGWLAAVTLTTSRDRFDAALRVIGYLTIAVAALELGQTVLEEEVLRSTHVSGPTRARRFLSRFMVVVVVALGVESLVAVFHFAHSDPGHLPHAATVAAAAAVLLAAWGVFVALNRRAEELEPESMAATKQEDQEIEAAEE